MTDDDKANVYALLRAHHLGDHHGELEMLTRMDSDEMRGVIVSLLSVLHAVCEVTMWVGFTDAQVDDLLAKMSRA